MLSWLKIKIKIAKTTKTEKEKKTYTHIQLSEVHYIIKWRIKKVANLKNNNN